MCVCLYYFPSFFANMFQLNSRYFSLLRPGGSEWCLLLLHNVLVRRQTSCLPFAKETETSKAKLAKITSATSKVIARHKSE